MQTGPRKGAVN